jgi:septal ring factor EnvC (AmiA/AmiB activator)
MDRMSSFHETVFSKLIFIVVTACLLATAGAVRLHSAPATLTGIITADKLRVRELPDVQSPVIAVLRKGTQVSIHNHLNSWYEIMLGDRRGFIGDRFAEVQKTIDEEDASRRRSLKDFQRIQKQIDRISRHIAERRTELESFSQKESSAVFLLDDIDRSLNQSRNKSESLRRDIASLKQKIDETLSASEEVAVRIKQSEENAGKRVIAMYKLDGAGKMGFLMSAESLQDWAERKYAMQRILSADERTLVRLSNDRKKLESLYEKQKSQYADKETLEKNYAAQIQSIETEKRRRQKLLKEIRTQKKMEIDAIEALNQAAEKLNATIEALNQEDADPFSQTAHVGENFISSKGLLPMPVKGKIVTKYGLNRIGRLNMEAFRNGIDIQADRGEPVQSVFAGRVLYSEWYKGFGNLMIIDHGNQYYSVYGHLEERFKQKGDKVETSETIGTVGDTGSVTGTGLYFEIRHRGKPMDPVEWIKTG